jgi:hypothetical protein
VLTKDPRDVGVGVGVAAVQEVPVIEVERGLVGALRCIRRLQDLPPGASACGCACNLYAPYLPYRRVPVRVVRIGILELLRSKEAR